MQCRSFGLPRTGSHKARTKAKDFEDEAMGIASWMLL